MISILHKDFSHFLSLWPKPQYLPQKRKQQFLNNNNNANDKKNQKNKQHQQTTATSCALTNQSNKNNTCNMFLNTHDIDCAHVLKNQINPQNIETSKLSALLHNPKQPKQPKQPTGTNNETPQATCLITNKTNKYTVNAIQNAKTHTIQLVFHAKTP